MNFILIVILKDRELTTRHISIILIRTQEQGLADRNSITIMLQI